MNYGNSKDLTPRLTLPKGCWLLGVAALCVLLLWPASGEAVTFIFTKIADTDTPIPGGTGSFINFNFGDFPSLDGGNVAFRGTGSSNQTGIYIGSGGPLTVVVDANTLIPGSSGILHGFSNPSFDGGNAAFKGYFRFSQGIYTHIGGTLNVVADTSTAVPGGTGNFSSFPDSSEGPSLDGGNIAFIGKDSSGKRGIYTNIGGSLNVVANTSTAIPGGSGNFTFFRNPSLDGENVAFTGFNSSFQPVGIYTNIGGTLHAVADTSTPVPGGSGNFAGADQPSLDGGNVAFRGSLFDQAFPQAGIAGIYTSIGGSLNIVADPNTMIPGGTGTFTFFSDPSLDGENVAFRGFGSSGQQGIYIYIGSSLAKVIDRNDTLDGKTLISPISGREGLSGNSIAFFTEFTDGSEGFYRADLLVGPPPSLPSPTATPPLSSFPSVENIFSELPSFIDTRGSEFSPETRDFLINQTTPALLNSPLLGPGTKLFFNDWANALEFVAFFISAMAAGADITNPITVLQFGIAVESKIVPQEIQQTLQPIELITESGVLLVKLSNVGLISSNPLSFGLSLISASYRHLLAPLARLISQDPFDPDFNEVFSHMIPATVPINLQGFPSEINDLLTQINRESYLTGSYLNAVHVSMNRYGSALSSGDALSAALQLEAFLYYLNLFRNSSLTTAGLFQELVTALEAQGIQDIVYDPSVIIQAQNLVLTQGFPDLINEFWINLGATEQDLQDIKNGILDLEPPVFQGTQFSAISDLANILSWASGSTPSHFLCYQARKSRLTPRFEPVDVFLADQFLDKDFKVKKPFRLCNPASKDGGPITDPDTHLVGYKMRRARGEPRHEVQRFIKVVNQFGTIFVDTKRPDRLLVPSAKSLTDPVNPPDPFAHDVDHFKCYRVKRTRGTPKFPKGITVSIGDQFTDPPKVFKVKKPTSLCIPVDKNGEGIKFPDNHLMCYKVRRARGEPRHQRVRGIHVNNQFGPLQLDTRKPREVCVPSEKILP